MKKTTKKLPLRTETLRNLDQLELANAAGGTIVPTDVYCPTHYYGCSGVTAKCTTTCPY